MLACRVLKRSLSTLDVVGIGINATIGSGIFLLPGLVATLLGPASLLTILGGGLIALLISLCFAVLGSSVSATGGAYLYARQTFGDFVGFEVGWLHWCSRITSWAALTQGFVIALASVIPAVNTPTLRTLIVVTLVVGLSAINLRGAKQGAWVSTVSSIAKLAPMAVFIVVGVFYIRPQHFTPFAPQGYGNFGEATLLIFYAYQGFEAVVVPAGEMKDPKRSTARALISVSFCVALIYIGIFTVCLGVLPELGLHENPVADAASKFLGPVGSTLVALGVTVSILGINAAMALITPRCLFALAEHQEVPRFLAKVHPRYNTPSSAIICTGVLTLGLALSGSFKDLAVISVLARAAQYVSTALATLVHTWRGNPSPDSFRLPLGPLIPAIASVAALWLVSQANTQQVWGAMIAAGIGAPIYLLSRRHATSR